MRNGLYPRLAAQGMRQNRRFFVPYLLALAGLTAAFYVMSALCADPGVLEMRGFTYVMVMMQIGMFVAGVLSAVLLLYINSFLMKQRKKELGLYNILGMGKGNIALIQCWAMENRTDFKQPRQATSVFSPVPFNACGRFPQLRETLCN